ncbi:hypothetical protein [Pseudarthrobacter sulfonivorans]|uniref:hypothetical protein n=1 Tax=Pseudarthrobacter sulfonivorans TaxID=121292 RepID=UPI002107DB02|nr:hypothetical protein [Pseudarthrobacter sulfonivorans]
MTVIGFGCSRNLSQAEQSSLWEFRERLLSIRWVTEANDSIVVPRRIASQDPVFPGMRRSELLPDRWQTTKSGLHKANGLAIHADRSASEHAAIREIVERAALFRLWYSSEVFKLEFQESLALPGSLTLSSYWGLVGTDDYLCISVIEGEDVFVIGSAIRDLLEPALEHSQAEALMVAEGVIGKMESPYVKASSTTKLGSLSGPLAKDRRRYFAELVERCTESTAPRRLEFSRDDILLYPLISWEGAYLTRAIIDRGNLSVPLNGVPVNVPVDPFV